MSDSSDLDAMVIAALQGDAALMAIATDGVWFDIAPTDSTRFVIVSLQTSADEGELSDMAWETSQYLVKAVLLNGSGPDAKAAAARIFAVLQGLQYRLSPAALPAYHLMRVERVERVRYTETDPVLTTIRWQHRGGAFAVQAQPLT